MLNRLATAALTVTLLAAGAGAAEAANRWSSTPDGRARLVQPVDTTTDTLQVIHRPKYY